MDTLNAQCLHLLRKLTSGFLKNKTGKGPEMINEFSVKVKVFLKLKIT